VPSMPYENQLIQPQPADDQAGGLDLLGFLRRRKSFVIVLGLLGTAVGYMMFQRQTPQYRSDSQVQVIHRSYDPIIAGKMSDSDLSDSDFVIKSPKTLLAAYKNHGLAELSSLSGHNEDDAVALLASFLTTKPLSAKVIQISATGSNPGDMRRIAQAASEEYVASQRGNYKDAAEEVRELFTQVRDEYGQKVRQAEVDHLEFRKTSKLSTDGENPHKGNAKAAYAKVSEFELQKTQRKAELDSLEAAIQRGGSHEAVMLLVGKGSESATPTPIQQPNTPQNLVVNNEPVDMEKSLRQALFPLESREAELEESGMGFDHPTRKRLRAQIEMTRKHYQDLAGISSKNAAAAAVVEAEQNKADEQVAADVAPDFLTIYIQSLKEELLIIDKQQSEVLKLAEFHDKLAKELVQEEMTDQLMQREIERLQKLFDESTNKISEIQVNSGMGGVVAQILQPARHGYLVYPVISSFLGMGGFLGAFAGLVLGYLVEMADRSFRKPEDIIREFGVPIVGHIPFMTEQRLKSVPDSSRMDRTAVSIHLPRSRPAEAYRAVRTAICFSAFGGHHRVISVTSPAAGDGKSTLALNLALSLAQSGKRTILVESDFRRPKVHRLTGVDNDKGFVEVLRSEVELDEAIQPTEQADFFVLPCGRRPKDPAELLARPLFLQMLQALRERFEYVIIDTPPVLAVTDPCGVAARVDGVLVCMRLSRHTRDLGRRTVEQLRDIGATISGIVINGVEERDAYGYGNYRYSDYRYYYKNYNYKYGEYGSRDGREYYVDDNTSDLAVTTEARNEA
jgi:succinoglycan biosynthesis transport protein ExoP